jgi:hypothetical protein
MNRSEGDHVPGQKTGFETISHPVNDRTDRGLGVRQYGTSEDAETLRGQTSPSRSRNGFEELGIMDCVVQRPGCHGEWQIWYAN